MNIDFNKLEILKEFENEKEFYSFAKTLMEPGELVSLEIADIPTPDYYIIDSSNLDDEDSLYKYKNQIKNSQQNSLIKLQIFNYSCFCSSFEEYIEDVSRSYYDGGFIGLINVKIDGKYKNIIYQSKIGPKPALRN